MTDKIDPKLPHRITDPKTGKTKVMLGKVGFNMGLRRAGETREDVEKRKAQAEAQNPRRTLKG